METNSELLSSICKIAGTFLQDGKPEEALMVLKQTSSDAEEYVSLAESAKEQLSKLLMEKMNVAIANGNKSEATSIIAKYRETVGNSSMIDALELSLQMQNQESQQHAQPQNAPSTVNSQVPAGQGSSAFDSFITWLRNLNLRLVAGLVLAVLGLSIIMAIAGGNPLPDIITSILPWFLWFVLAAKFCTDSKKCVVALSIAFALNIITLIMMEHDKSSSLGLLFAGIDDLNVQIYFLQKNAAMVALSGIAVIVAACLMFKFGNALVKFFSVCLILTNSIFIIYLTADVNRYSEPDGIFVFFGVISFLSSLAALVGYIVVICKNFEDTPIIEQNQSTETSASINETNTQSEELAKTAVVDETNSSTQSSNEVSEGSNVAKVIFIVMCAACLLIVLIASLKNCSNGSSNNYSYGTDSVTYDDYSCEEEPCEVEDTGYYYYDEECVDTVPGDYYY